jgi:hypothetical protein
VLITALLELEDKWRLIKYPTDREPKPPCIPKVNNAPKIIEAMDAVDQAALSEPISCPCEVETTSTHFLDAIDITKNPITSVYKDAVGKKYWESFDDGMAALVKRRKETALKHFFNYKELLECEKAFRLNVFFNFKDLLKYEEAAKKLLLIEENISQAIDSEAETGSEQLEMEVELPSLTVQDTASAPALVCDDSSSSSDPSLANTPALSFGSQNSLPASEDDEMDGIEQSQQPQDEKFQKVSDADKMDDVFDHEEDQDMYQAPESTQEADQRTVANCADPEFEMLDTTETNDDDSLFEDDEDASTSELMDVTAAPASASTSEQMDVTDTSTAAFISQQMNANEPQKTVENHDELEVDMRDASEQEDDDLDSLFGDNEDTSIDPETNVIEAPTAASFPEQMDVSETLVVASTPQQMYVSETSTAAAILQPMYMTEAPIAAKTLSARTEDVEMEQIVPDVEVEMEDSPPATTKISTSAPDDSSLTVVTSQLRKEPESAMNVADVTMVASRSASFPPPIKMIITSTWDSGKSTSNSDTGSTTNPPQRPAVITPPPPPPIFSPAMSQRTIKEPKTSKALSASKFGSQSSTQVASVSKATGSNLKHVKFPQSEKATAKAKPETIGRNIIPLKTLVPSKKRSRDDEEQAGSKLSAPMPAVKRPHGLGEPEHNDAANIMNVTERITKRLKGHVAPSEDATERLSVAAPVQGSAQNPVHSFQSSPVNRNPHQREVMYIPDWNGSHEVLKAFHPEFRHLKGGSYFDIQDENRQKFYNIMLYHFRGDFAHFQHELQQAIKEFRSGNLTPYQTMVYRAHETKMKGQVVIKHFEEYDHVHDNVRKETLQNIFTAMTRINLQLANSGERFMTHQDMVQEAVRVETTMLEHTVTAGRHEYKGKANASIRLWGTPVRVNKFLKEKYSQTAAVPQGKRPAEGLDGGMIKRSRA